MSLLLSYINWKTKNTFRRIKYRSFGYRRPKMRYRRTFSNLKNDINEIIYNQIISGNPFLVSRLGGIEVDICYSFLLNSKIIKKTYSRKLIHSGKNLAGIFPKSKLIADTFSKVYLDSIKSIDLLGVWQDEKEKYLIEEYSHSNILLTELVNIEPFWHKNPWTLALKEKNVLVIHPFTESFKFQISKSQNKIHKQYSLGLMPSANYIFYKPIVSNGSNSVEEYSDWYYALNKMKLDISKIDYDVAIVAAGSYGLPLSSYIKENGKSVIHLAGVTQLLFGVIGSRWENSKDYSELFNENWIRPLEVDFDKSIRDSFVREEGAGYW